MTELKTKDIAKLVYKSQPYTTFLLGEAVKEGKITRTRKGYYEDNDSLKEWIKVTRGFE